MSQTSKIILVAILAALIGGGGVYLWQQEKATTELELPEETEESVISEPEILIEDDKSSYTFGDSEFELEYPSNWTDELDPKRDGKAWDSIVFSDTNNDRMMSIDCGFMGGGIGGYESEITDQESKTLVKHNEEFEVSYSEYSIEDEVSLYAIGTEGCFIFIQPIVSGDVAKDIYRSIQ